MRSILKVLLINFGVFVALIIVLEAVLTMVRPIGPLWNSKLFESGWRWAESAYREDLISNGVRGPHFWSEHEANQLGFRGRKIEYDDEDYVVLLVGDSQVEAAASYF
jgi:hypothetical protein